MYCSKCGNQMADGTTFCPACGQAQSLTPNAPHSPREITPSAPSFAAASVSYAGFWLRFAAYLIDSVVLGIAFFAVIGIFAAVTGVAGIIRNIPGDDSPANFPFVLVLFIFAIFAVLLVGTWMYHALMESSSWQATLGKRVLNLQVTDLVGRPISFGRASGRHFSKIISGMIPLGIGFILAGFTEKKQAIHDMITSCLVLHHP